MWFSRFHLFLSLLPSLVLSAPNGAGTLNFEDKAVPNDSTCAAYYFKPSENYHGFHIEGGTDAALPPRIYNTTQTQNCHQSSSGGGPWGKAATYPNVLYSDLNVTFTTVDNTLFDVHEISVATNWHWTMPIEDPGTLILVFLRGYDKNREEIISEQVQIYDQIPHTVELKGFRRLRSFTVSAWQGKWIDEDVIQLYPWVIYVDQLKYLFKK